MYKKTNFPRGNQRSPAFYPEKFVDNSSISNKKIIYEKKSLLTSYAKKNAEKQQKLDKKVYEM